MTAYQQLATAHGGNFKTQKNDKARIYEPPNKSGNSKKNESSLSFYSKPSFLQRIYRFYQ
jgi:hypothetical protein